MIALSKLITVLPFSPSTSRVLAPVNLPRPLTTLTFAAFCHTSQTTGQLIDHFLFPGTNLVDIGFRFAEDDTVFSQRFGFFDNFCYVQQCFRRDTADVQANTAKGVVTFYDYGFQT